MSYSLEKVNVVLPSSKIRSPGMLYKDKKDSFEVRTKYMEIQDKLLTFKTEIESPYVSFREIVTIPTEGSIRSNFSGIPKTLLDNFLSHSSSFQAASPGKMKTVSDKVASLTQRTKDILAVYGLELVMDNSKVSKDAYNLLKILTPEVGFFPYDFFGKLRIRKIVITNDMNKLPSSLQAVAFPIDRLETRKQVRQRLYKIVFDHLVVAHPEIIKQWRDTEYANLMISQTEILGELEEVFMSLMNNTEHSLLKYKPKKLRQMLANQYPEAMSEERFKSRNKENKKSYRVRFDTEPEPEPDY